MRRWGFLPWAIRPIRREQARKKLIKIAERYGFDVPWDAPVESLPVGVQQRVEILKLLYRDADILILDEPTAVLTPQEVTELFANLKKLKLEGKTILIITHKLKEVMEFTDHITVFRAGRVSGEVKTSETSPQDLANMMVGRKVLLQVEVPPQGECGSIALQASDLCFGKWLRNVNLKIRCGEIVGIAGIEGNGQSQLISAILDPANTDRLKSGRIEIFGNDVSHCSIAEILDQGVAVIPEDRQTQGLLLEQSVEENFLLGLHRLPRFTGGGWIRKSELRRSAGNAVRAYDVRPADLDWEAGGLSGGNQQKLIAAREFEKNPGFIIAAQPTRGVDVGAIEFLHRQLLKARTGGAGVLLVSSELDEVIGLSDRILVMYDGRFVGEFLRGSVTEQQLGLLMGGGVIHG
jgi:simple sugar transport system ATP-binding protein